MGQLAAGDPLFAVTPVIEQSRQAYVEQVDINADVDLMGVVEFKTKSYGRRAAMDKLPCTTPPAVRKSRRRKSKRTGEEREEKEGRNSMRSR